jgi:hypothetical protein
MIDKRSIDHFYFTQDEYERYQGCEELWKVVPNYEDYKISTTGKLLSFKHKKNGKIGSHCRSHNGYRRIQLYNGGGNFTTRPIHVIMGWAFLKNPDNLPEINHMNFVKDCNFLWNIEWISRKGNSEHASKGGRLGHYWRGKVGEECPHSGKLHQYDLYDNFIKTHIGVREVCRENGYARTRIAGCYNGKYESAYGFKWKLGEKV